MSKLGRIVPSSGLLIVLTSSSTEKTPSIEGKGSAGRKLETFLGPY